MYFIFHLSWFWIRFSKNRSRIQVNMDRFNNSAYEFGEDVAGASRVYGLRLYCSGVMSQPDWKKY